MGRLNPRRVYWAMEKKIFAENMPKRKSLQNWNHHNLMANRILLYPTLNIKDQESSGMKLGDRVGQCYYPNKKTSILDKTTQVMQKCTMGLPNVLNDKSCAFI